ncbi:MAG: YggS family pyridoxal phosphate-dependent enzyme [Candidatus Omnitrophica bacterium]|nr:YggS family pyridoxal phosphate-dependent enzyme [Candidatus Omnitrophota bacterium]
MEKNISGSTIKKNVSNLLESLPGGTVLIAATKTRTHDEIEAAIAGGVAIIGENYVQEAEAKFAVLKDKVSFHLVGHLQKNKVKKAVKIFDMIQTLDSKELAVFLARECEKIHKVMPVLIEINSAGESQKSGIDIGRAEELVREVMKHPSLSLEGLMTMGPASSDDEAVRSAFCATKGLFDRIGSTYPQLSNWQYLSMGMSDSYTTALSCGANMVRIGTLLFGPRRMR